MAGAPVTIEDVRRAAGVIHGHVRRTPVMSCASLREGVWLKAELFQRTGSFKPRGVLAKLASLTAAERRRGVVAASSGNHAQALAFCAGEVGLDCVVVMPASASEQKVAAARDYGATVDQTCATSHDAIEQAALAAPFPDPAQQATEFAPTTS